MPACYRCLKSLQCVHFCYQNLHNREATWMLVTVPLFVTKHLHACQQSVLKNKVHTRLDMLSNCNWGNQAQLNNPARTGIGRRRGRLQIARDRLQQEAQEKDAEIVRQQRGLETLKLCMDFMCMQAYTYSYRNQLLTGLDLRWQWSDGKKFIYKMCNSYFCTYEL